MCEFGYLLEYEANLTRHQIQIIFNQISEK